MLGTRRERAQGVLGHVVSLRLVECHGDAKRDLSRPTEGLERISWSARRSLLRERVPFASASCLNVACNPGGRLGRCGLVRRASTNAQ